MKTLEELLVKLNSISFITEDRTSISSQNGWKVSYNIELHVNSDLMIQVVISVSHNGNSVQTWGCESNDDNEIFVDWFLRKRAVCVDSYFVKKTDEQQASKKIFANM